MEQQKPTLADRFHSYVPRFVTNPSMAKDLSQDTDKYPTLPSPPAPWTKVLKSESGEKSPQIIAHRGYRAKYPENSMLAFRQALASGAQALETDLHLTKDNVVVLTHDGSLKRCYGVDKKVLECDWSYVSELRSVASPHEPMPRLVDLLEYLAEPSQENIWLLLDIKMDDEPNLMMQSIAKAIKSVSASKSKPWTERIVLGIWALKYLTPCATHLPDYALSNIGFSTIYARNFLTARTPNVTFNMLYWALMMPISGPRFIAQAHESNRAVYAWTVNDEATMKWCMKQKVDGIITDDVEKLVAVKAAWHRGDRRVNIKLRTWIFSIWIWLLSSVLSVLITRRLDRRSSGRKSGQ